MPVLPADLVDDFEKRILDLQVEPAKILPALEDAYTFAQDEANASWETDEPELPQIARTIIFRGARRIIVNPDQAREEQSGDTRTAMSIMDVFSRDELRRLHNLRVRSRVGSIRLTSEGLSETADFDRFLPPEGTIHYYGEDSGYARP